ncbi:putative disease resistance protein RGA4 [Punica granatum]|uniref:Disease resistance protein RGA4 n=1 Tax=Punica granatum TaxID=22663 RepID=A0A6P8DUL5_PUNGR|nr:putative disease resistance protein RGA4 [Punica granatum]
MGHKIKKIRMRLNKITVEKDAFNLNKQTNFSSGSRSIWRETHSRVNVSEIIGRDRDRDMIVKRLLCPDADKNPFIVSIVGIGGMGKTALAKLVCNDERVKLHFDSRIWVCASEEFDPKIILQKIIKSATQESTIVQSIHLLELEQLQAKLQELLQDNKFLLVLDDVWSNIRGQWRELRDLLTGATIGSSVIMTTRSSEVTSAGGSCYDHKLKGFSCQQLGELPKWLHKLLRLKILAIVGCDGISTLPDGIQDLTALKLLRISDCSELGGRCRPNGPDWHKIAHIPNIEIDGEQIVAS